MLRKKETSSASMRLLGVLSLFLTCTLSFVVSASAQAAQQQMATQSDVIKLDLTVVKKKDENISPSQSAMIRVVLRDAKNQPVKAPKDFTIDILVKPEKGEPIEKREVTIKQGEDSMVFTLSPTKQNGIFDIQAKQSELMEGGTLLVVRPKTESLKLRRVPKANKTGQSRPTAPKLTAKKAPVKSGAGLPAGDWPYWAGAKLIPAYYSPQAGSEPGLVLKKVPSERSFLADGIDAATIWVVLTGRAFNEDIQITLVNSEGSLSPSTLTIPRGQKIATAKLTSDQMGVVRIGYRGSSPDIGLQNVDEIEIKFVAPITTVKFSAVPSRIPLVDRADLVVRLYSSNDKVVETDEEREISIDLSAPLGSLEPKFVKILPGQSEGRVNFIPTSRGQVVFTAHTAGFTDLPPVTLEVTIPLLILALSMLGGLIGGLIAYKTDRNSRWWRIALGLVTGFVLYWACIFVFSSFMPRSLVLNEFSAVCLPVLGGWLGTEVFTLVLRRLGFAS
ncbi:MAG: hypothetical protein AABN33_15845 [Acidobacteriota bacterium]